MTTPTWNPGTGASTVLEKPRGLKKAAAICWWTNFTLPQVKHSGPGMVPLKAKTLEPKPSPLWVH